MMQKVINQYKQRAPYLDGTLAKITELDQIKEEAKKEAKPMLNKEIEEMRKISRYVFEKLLTEEQRAELAMEFPPEVNY